MFDIGWTEMLVIAVVMIVVVGPKDLPKMLRTFGRTTAKLRAMAGDFQKQFNEALKEAELDDVKKSVDSLRNLNPANEIKKSLNPFEKAASDVRAGLQSLQQPAKPADPASPTPVAAEPLKNGATAMPMSGPTAMPEPPVIPAAEPPPPIVAQPAPIANGAANGAGTTAASVAATVVPVSKAAAPKAPKTASTAASKPAAASKSSAAKASAGAKTATKTSAKAAAGATAAAGTKAPAKPRKSAGSPT